MEKLSLKANLLQQFINRFKRILSNSNPQEAKDLLKLANTLLEQQKQIDALKSDMEDLRLSVRKLQKNWDWKWRA